MGSSGKAKVKSEIPVSMADHSVNDDDFIHEARDRALFNRISGEYARKDTVESSSLARRHRLFSAVGPLLERNGELGTIVQVGCGVGEPARYLDGRYKRYIGVDYAEAIIAVGRAVHGNQRALFIVANAKSLPLPDKIADTVFVLGALHHMRGLDAVISSLVQVAKPGANLVMMEPFRGNPVIQLMRFVRGLVDATYSREQRFFSRRELVELLSRHGFWDIEIGFQGYFSTPFAQVILPLGKLASALSRVGVGFDQWLDRHLPEPLRFIAWNIVVRARFPLSASSSPTVEAATEAKI